MDPKSLTFKQYLHSKEQLLNAIQSTPVTITEHVVHKYCTISIGEDKDNSFIIQLKPKQRVLVEWDCGMVPPIPTSIQVQGSDTVEDEEKLDIFWSNDKLHKWLTRHTTEKTNHGYKT